MMLLTAALLGAAAIAVWFLATGARAAARVHLRFASMLFAALAAASAIAPPVADEVALLVAAIALPVLAFAAYAGFEKAMSPMPATLLLGTRSSLRTGERGDRDHLVCAGARRAVGSGNPPDQRAPVRCRALVLDPGNALGAGLARVGVVVRTGWGDACVSVVFRRWTARTDTGAGARVRYWRRGARQQGSSAHRYRKRRGLDRSPVHAGSSGPVQAPARRMQDAGADRSRAGRTKLFHSGTAERPGRPGRDRWSGVRMSRRLRLWSWNDCRSRWGTPSRQRWMSAFSRGEG